MDTSGCEWRNLRSRLWHKILDLLPLRVRQIQALFKRVNHLPDVTKNTGSTLAKSLMVAMKNQSMACNKLSYELEKKTEPCFFVPSLDGGIGRVTALLASGMQASGENVEVWSASPQSGYANELERSLTVKCLGDGSVSSSLFLLCVSSVRARQRH